MAEKMTDKDTLVGSLLDAWRNTPNDLKGEMREHGCGNHLDALEAFMDDPETNQPLAHLSARLAGGEAVWRGPDEVPNVPAGHSGYFWVAVKRKHNGKTYSFPAQYLNGMLLSDEFGERDERTGNRYHHGPVDEDEGCFPATGWHKEKEHGEFDGVFLPLLSESDELVAWREVASYPGTGHPTPNPSAPPAQVIVCKVCEELCDKIGMGYVPRGGDSKTIVLEQPASAVPEGFVLVPVEMTDAMRRAGQCQLDIGAGIEGAWERIIANRPLLQAATHQQEKGNG